MEHTQSFSDVVIERAKTDAVFRVGLLEEAVSEFISNGDMQVCKSLLRDCIEAGLGFAALARVMSVPAPELHSKFTGGDNPTAQEFLDIVAALCAAEKIERFEVEATKREEE